MKKVQFADSALRYGFYEDDFFELLSGDYIKLQSQRGIEDIYELLGQNLAGDYMHVVYRNLSGKQGIRVFHMSRMTERQKARLKRYLNR